jgi:hypothetical protein
LIEQLEDKLDSFDCTERREALLALCEKVSAGEVTLPERGTDVNLHCHTFFSYNTHGYSPIKFAWLARKHGFAVAGIVDFDVLDGLEEFLDAARLLGLKACAGLETRVFVPEFAGKVMTSPGEPGITYHMGVGLPSARLEDRLEAFISNLKRISQDRNQGLTERVNAYLNPVELDYEQDVLTLTPAGNATERHICLAYAKKARKVFGDDEDLAGFWTKKLGPAAKSLGLPESRELLNTIRARTMKRGGVGYVQPDTGSFPKMSETNEFVVAAGGIPTLTWLDGTTDGEKEIERLLDVAMASGVAAINIIPDRHYTAGAGSEKLANLYEVVELAERRYLPVVVGTEMNSPGQKFVDTFESAELTPLLPIFLKGAHVVYAHSVLQRECGLGYMSDWAGQNFAGAAEKKEFFEKLGRAIEPQQHNVLAGSDSGTKPGDILEKIGGRQL